MRVLACLGMSLGMVALMLAVLAPGLTAAGLDGPICQVPGDFASIQAAVDEPACAVVDLEAGTIGETVVISRSVTIQGQGRASTIVDGQGWDTVFAIRPGNQVTITDMTITGGRGVYHGAIANEASDLMLGNVLITQNTAVGTPVIAGMGGCAFLGHGASVSIEGSTMSKNEAVRGGCFYVSEGATLTVNDSLLDSNRGKDLGDNRGYGSAIFNEATVTLVNTEVANHTYGDGTVFNYGRLFIEGGAFQGNERSAIQNRVEATATISGTLFDGNDSYYGGGFYNHAGASASLNRVTMTNNDASNGGGAGSGISNSGALTLTHSLLSGNIRGAIRHDGYLLASTVISQCQIINNQTSGVAIGDSGTVLIEGSIIAGNGGQGSYGGLVVAPSGWWRGDALIRNSTISGNQGGGIYVDFDPDDTSLGGPGTLTLENSTIAGNVGHWRGGAIRIHQGHVVLRNVTIYDNAADAGSGLWSDSPYATFSMVNTIIANSGPGMDCDWGGYDESQRKDVFASLGHNLDGDGSCELDEPGDMPNHQPYLGFMGDHGGQTPTHAPLPWSPVVDAGDDATCLATDQREVMRPIDGNGDQVAQCDIGAVEYDGPLATHMFLPSILR